MRNIFTTLILGTVIFLAFLTPVTNAESEAIITETPTVYIFGRDDCGFCKAQFKWMKEQGVKFEYLNIVSDSHAKELYDQVTAKHKVSRVTPVTVVGENIFVGFNGPETTGKSILSAIEAAHYTDIDSVEAHIERAPSQDVPIAGGCTGITCEVSTGSGSQFVFDLPLLGIVDLKSFSLFSLSAILGTIDGFNPCAMWVLFTFLVILSQAGSRKKMVFLAGVFILAEAIMYNLILNVWYKTWDFIALDQYVTPLVGLLALGGGLFFLWRWYRNKDADLVCDITDLETQSKTINKFQAIVNQPVTIMSILAILLIAFSVNIIEFACSIGIPQAYTKILELNLLNFWQQQWYIFVYTIGYMIDDIIVFGLAIWGYSKLQSHGGKYAQLSLLIGGVLMLLLGLLLVIDPSLLVL